MDSDTLFQLADESQDLLEQTLTQEDRETLHEVYKDFGSQIIWGKVITNAFQPLLEMAEDLIETKDMSKEGGPWGMVGKSDMALFSDEDNKSMARKHLLLLMLAKKLLGGLKTRVNRSIKDIRILSDDEEIELEAVVEEATVVAGKLRYEALDREASDSDDEAEEERNVARHEVVADIDIAPSGDCRQNGRHIRVTVRWKRQNDSMFQETYCKDCRQIVKRVEGRKREETPSEDCTHSNAEWVEGKEGSEAACIQCKARIPNPEEFQWIGAGLEPFGDDPSQDEAITLFQVDLCSDS